MSEEETDKPKTQRLEIDSKVDAELQEALKAGLEDSDQPIEQEQEKRVEFTREETFDTPADSIDPRVFDNPALKLLEKQIEVTDFEKETFYESLIMDEPFRLNIEVIGDKTINIGSRSTYEQALCYACVGDMLEESRENSATQPDILLWLQRFSCAISIHSIFGSAQSPISFKGESESINPEHKQQLRKVAAERFVNMKYPRWQAILNAFMIFTGKEKLLLENVGNRDFWNPAD